jgi:hypothetical protein
MAAHASAPLAVHEHAAGGLASTLEFLKRTRVELRALRWVLAWRDRLQIHDVNRDVFEVAGLGYADPDIVPVLKSLGASYDPETVHLDPAAEPKQFRLGRCRPWAEDRAM